jgi:hypothetical protein
MRAHFFYPDHPLQDKKAIRTLTSYLRSAVYVFTVVQLIFYQCNLVAEQEVAKAPHEYVSDFAPKSLEYFVNECSGKLDKSQYINVTFKTACGSYIEGALMSIYILNKASKGSLSLCVDKDYTRKELREEFLVWVNDGKHKSLNKKATAVFSFLIERFECKSLKHNNRSNSDAVENRSD